MIQFRTLTDLDRTIRRGLSVLPQDLDLVVGIPRSGLLPATLLSHYLRLPLTDVEGLCERRLFRSPREDGRGDSKDFFDRRLRILVVDDSVWSGNQMRATRERIARAGLNHEYSYCAIYVTPEGKRLVDYSMEVLPKTRLFAWNMTKHSILDVVCMDIDGVLCVDPTAEQNDDGQEYRRFLLEAASLYLPVLRVGWLVTNRLEKYRALTEEWLARHRVTYRHLIMMDLPDKEARLRSDSHATFKADVYRSSGALLFIESSDRQAREIARRSGLPVLCMDTRSMVYPPLSAMGRRVTLKIRKGFRSLIRRLSGAPRRNP